MPIYAYRCDECGFAKDVLQKISDPVLTVCPSCGKSSYKKQVTAAGFQLKGTGWYVTDFRGGSAPATGTAPSTESGGNSDSSTSSSTSSTSSSTSAGSSTAAAPAPASTPGGSST